MRIPVRCKNCGLKWLRVTAFFPPLELTEDLQYNCPKCGSNWFEPIEESEIEVGIEKIVEEVKEWTESHNGKR